MAEFEIVQQLFGTGADAALIVIGVSIWKLDKRVSRLEWKVAQ